MSAWQYFWTRTGWASEQEEIYRRALARFPEHSWYDKLARFYLRYKKDADFEKLTQEAVKTFSGTELEQYFANVGYGGTPALYLRLNQYANQRFPHNPVFVRNLLSAYHNSHTYDDAAWQSLLRQHWFEESDLRSQFFEYLSAKGELESELESLRPGTPAAGQRPGQSQWDEVGPHQSCRGRIRGPGRAVAIALRGQRARASSSGSAISRRS